MKIGLFISDATPPTEKVINKAVSFLASHNIEAVMPYDNLLHPTAMQKADIIHNYFLDPSVDGLMSFWGGVKSIEVLRYLDYDLIRRNKKFVVGYSDTTVVLQALAKKAACPTYYGPALISFAKPQFANESLAALLDALQRSNYAIPEVKTVNIESDLAKEPVLISGSEAMPKAFVSGEARGVAQVGNLQTLLLLNHTEYAIDLEGKILFIEEAEEVNEAWFRRFISQLTLQLDFLKLKGLVISRFTKASNISTSQLRIILEEYGLNDASFPIVINFNAGHCDPIMTIPLYSRVHMVATPDRVVITVEGKMK